MEEEVISDIVRRVKKTGRFTETAEIMADSLRQQGYSPSRISAEVRRRLNADPEYQKAISENTVAYKREVMEIIKETEREAEKAGDKLVAEAGEMSFRDDMRLWSEHGTDLSKPNDMEQLLKAMAEQTKGALRNITQTTGFKNTALGTTGVLNAYQREMDLAIMKVSSGAFSWSQAVKDCVHRLSQNGLRSIDYGSGRSYQLDTAARMCVRTGMNQLTAKIQERNLQNTGTELVYVDAHGGARPEHAEWQGEVYYWNKPVKRYDSFVKVCQYGDMLGIMGINCAHHFYPYWEGDAIPEYTEPDPIEYNGKEYSYYEATQEMRKQERAIRATKREIEATRAIGGDTTQLKAQLAAQRRSYNSFSSAANIRPRTSALGVQKGSSDLSKTTTMQKATSNQWFMNTANPKAKSANSPIGEKAPLDLSKSFIPKSLGYSDKINENLAKEAKKIAELAYKEQSEYGVVVNLKTGVTSDIFTDNMDENVSIPKKVLQEIGTDPFAFLHIHTRKTEVSIGDLNYLESFDNMDAIIAARTDGILTSIQHNGLKVHRDWSEEFGQLYRDLWKSNKYSEAEIEYMVRNQALSKWGIEGVKYDG